MPPEQSPTQEPVRQKRVERRRLEKDRELTTAISDATNIDELINSIREISPEGIAGNNGHIYKPGEIKQTYLDLMDQYLYGSNADKDWVLDNFTGNYGLRQKIADLLMIQAKLLAEDGTLPIKVELKGAKRGLFEHFLHNVKRVFRGRPPDPSLPS